MRDRTDSKQNSYLAGSRKQPVFFRCSHSSAGSCFSWDFLMAEREGLLGALRLAPSGPP